MHRDDPEWVQVLTVLFTIATVTLAKLEPNSDFIDFKMRKRAIKAMILS